MTEKKLRSTDAVVNMFSSNPEHVDELRTSDPVKVLAKVAKEVTSPAFVNDQTLYRIAVCVLGFLAITTSLESLILAGIHKEIPQVLVASGSTAACALVGRFSPSPSSNK
ncbi:MAG: hypothetical protein NT172_13930 [Planctomycetota bacterium]|nr:hypothetical protein [Planctomycetota bacterium]